MTEEGKVVLCAACEADITDPLQQYGSIYAPLCWKCYNGGAEIRQPGPRSKFKVDKDGVPILRPDLHGEGTEED